MGPCICGDKACGRCFPTTAHLVKYQETIAESVIRLLDVATATLGNGDETFTECRVCGEVDCHDKGCFVGAAQSWLDEGTR